MVIGQLGGWLKEHLGNNPLANVPRQPEPQQHPISEMPQQPQTIQAGVPLPSFQMQPDGGYNVQGMQPGHSAFAALGGVGVLQHPQPGVVYFDPTGRMTQDQPMADAGNYLAMPMAPMQHQPMTHMQPIGGNYARN